MEELGREFFNLEVIRDMLPELLTEAVKNTVVFTILSFTGGIAWGLVLALMRISRRRLLRWPAAVYIDVLRGLPALLTIVFIGFGLPIALGVQFPYERYTPGCLALSLVYGAYIAETIRAGIEAVPRGQVDAARALGMPYRTVMREVVVPQAFRIVVPPLTNELLALFKDTSLLAVLGTVTGGKEILKFARDFVNTRGNTSPLVAGGLAYLLITLPMLRLVARLEARGRPAR
ncbi:MAG TPA: amino acid ABC transporter permease [Acidimicrobiales bacterium]|nr:amino acid ABC transporter permease [Acidimicrobiales bacterium]